jgi:outer membrane lipoprotein SlyB
MQPALSTPLRPEIVPPWVRSPAPLGVPSQDPREQAQIEITADESRREMQSTLAGGGVVAGVVLGGALGAAVAGPVGTVVGATVGAAIGATTAVAAAAFANRE